MTTLTTLPLTETTPVTLSELSYIPRKGDALQRCAISNDENVYGLNLMRGCAFRCGFCSARAYPGMSEQSGVAIYADTVNQVVHELSHKRVRAVLICPSTDPFPSIPDVQDLTAEVVTALAERGAQSWLMTRGVIRPTVLQTLIRHREQVQLTFSLTTLNEKLTRLLEPGTASPTLRIEQIERCLDAGLKVKVALDPLVPNVTDSRENLEEVLDALESVGVHEVSAGYMFLRQGIVENLQASLASTDLADLIQGAFRGGPVLTAPGLAAARYLPRGRRQRGFALLKSLAARHGIEVQISGISNPDFATPRKNESKQSSTSLLARFLKNADPQS